MPSFRVSGSTGQAPTTVWMSPVADNYTMLISYIDTLASEAYATPISVSSTSLTACKFANKFNPIAVSFGAFNTAPDGTTNTSQKIVEDSSNAEHYVQAGLAMEGPWPIFRVAGVFKADERTRIAFQCYQAAGIGGATMTCGFDLAGGQIAYGATFVGGGGGAANTLFALRNQKISPVGDGFYLCIADVQALVPSGSNGIAKGLSYRFLLDNGSGTAAPSLSYAGDGTSGLYGWKHSVLPRQAWKINATTFRDDFDDVTMANIDLQNTLASGFDWYVSANYYNIGLGEGWFLANAVPPPPAATGLSVSGSKLLLPYQENPGFGLPGGLFSYSNNNGTPVGTGWTFPALFEASFAYGFPSAWHDGNLSWWMGSCEFADNIIQGILNADGCINYSEWDFAESEGSIFAYGPNNNAFGANLANGHLGVSGAGARTFTSNGVSKAMVGYNPYQPAFLANTSVYTNTGVSVESSGTYYYQSSGGTQSTPPSTNWTSISYPIDSGPAPPPVDPLITTDLTQQHIYTHILTPYDRTDPLDFGCDVSFFDGVCRKCNAWSPTADPFGNADPVRHTLDWQRFFAMFNYNGNTANDHIGGGFDMSIDYFKVMQ